MPINLRISWKLLLAASLLALSLGRNAFSQETPPATEEQAAALQKEADAAVANQKAAEDALKKAQQQSQQLLEALNKIKADVAKAQADLKKAEAELKPKQDAATKAAADKAAADKLAADAAKAAEDLAKQLEEAKKKSDAEKAKAEAATIAATEATAAVTATQQLMAAATKIIADSAETTKQAEAAVAAFKPQFDQAQNQFAAVSLEAINKQKAAEQALISLGKLVSFSDSVAPIFAKRCLACHNARTAKGRYNMDNFAAIVKGGESGEALSAGKSADSILFMMVEDGTMPKDADPLTKEQIELIKKWIDTGAKLNAGVDPNAELITVIPKEPQPLPPDAYRVPVPVTALAFTPDGSFLASSGYHEIVLWNPADGKQVRRITNIAERTYDIAFSADGKTMAVASGTPAQIGEVKLFNVADGQLLADMVTTNDSVFAVAFSPDGKQLASAGADRSIRIYDIESRKQLVLIEDHADWVMDVAWSPDGAKLASASRDKTSKVFDAKTGDSLVTFNGHAQPVFGAAFTPDGTQVVTSGSDRQIRIWNVGNAMQARAIGGFGNEVFRIEVTPDGQVFSCSADKSVRQHKIADGAAVRTFGGHTDWVYSVAFHPATKKVAGGSYTGEVRLWNLDDGAELAKFVAAPGYTPPDAAAQK